MSKAIFTVIAGVSIFAGTAFGALDARAQNALGEVTFKVEALPAQVGQRGTLQAVLVVTNNSKTSARAFVRGNPDPSASDNRGHSWGTNISYDVSGIHVCRGQSACLAGELQQTEQAATLIGAGQRAQIQIKFERTGTVAANETYGDALNVTLTAYVQPVKEENGKFTGGSWRTMSFGATNIPLRKN